MTHPNTQRLTAFYEGFARRDPAPMRALYAPDAQFGDAAFPDLRGPAIGDMWAMLCETGKDLRIEFRDVTADAERGSVHWEAWYTFGGRRPVHNVIEARFRFGPDGLVTEHRDSFDFWRWSKQALGLPGTLLGWSPLLQRAVQGSAGKTLASWRRRQAAKG